MCVCVCFEILVLSLLKFVLLLYRSCIQHDFSYHSSLRWGLKVFWNKIKYLKNSFSLQFAIKHLYHSAPTHVGNEKLMVAKRLSRLNYIGHVHTGNCVIFSIRVMTSYNAKNGSNKASEFSRTDNWASDLWHGRNREDKLYTFLACMTILYWVVCR